MATTDYAAATATASFTVNPEAPTLVFASIPVETYGDPAFTVSASSASTGAVTYSVTSGQATINSTGGDNQLHHRYSDHQLHHQSHFGYLHHQSAAKRF